MWYFGRFELPGSGEILQRRGPECLRHPLSTGMMRASLTITATRVNMTVQSVLYSGPTPIKVCRNPGMIFPVTGNPEGNFGRFKSPVPVDYWDWSVAVR